MLQIPRVPLKGSFLSLWMWHNTAQIAFVIKFKDSFSWGPNGVIYVKCAYIKKYWPIQRQHIIFKTFSPKKGTQNFAFLQKKVTANFNHVSH